MGITEKYGAGEGEKEKDKEGAGHVTAEEISIAGPMGFWIGILLVGFLLEFVIAPVARDAGVASTTFVALANFILYLPGAVILPLIVAVWAGSKVGHIRKKAQAIGKIGLINAIYAAVIYSIAIFVIYLVVYYISSSALPTSFTLAGFVLNLLVIPDAIVLALTPLLAMLSAARQNRK